MADAQVAIRWVGEGLRFRAEHPSANDFHSDGDGKQSHSPVQQLLLSLASCTAADVVDILAKMRVPLSGLQVDIEGDRMPEPPRFYTAIRMRFTTFGVADADREKVERAILLSEEKYCSVRHSLRSDIRFSSELVLA